MKTKEQQIKDLVTLYINISLSLKYRGYSRQQRMFLDKIEQEYIILTEGQFIENDPGYTKELEEKEMFMV